MIQNNLDPEVAEDPENLVVYGGSGRAARSWEAFDAILSSLENLSEDETLLVQSGKPVGVFKTHPLSPRVLIANSLLVPRWATPEKFSELELKGLTMYGQMTAGSWIYIGTQGILQGTYNTFAALAKKHYGSNLSGKLVVSGGLGGMGGAQPLAATMCGAAYLGIDVDPHRVERRLETKYLDEKADSLDDALERLKTAQAAGKPLSVGLVANCADIMPELVERMRSGSVKIDVATDQTSAHDALHGYVPNGMSFEEAIALRKKNPDKYIERSKRSMIVHCEAIVELQKLGAIAFDYGNNLRGQAEDAGLTSAFNYPGFTPEYIRPLFCEGSGPFRWVALSGETDDIFTIDRELMKLFPDNENLQQWLTMAGERVAFQGLPSRICWLNYLERVKAGLMFNDLVRDSVVQAPIVIGRDHLDCGSVASPNRETEAMQDGSDAIADWPILNALLNTASGATWVSVHHGGGVGIGLSIHAGQVVVADGTDEARKRLQAVLTNDPGTGVMRHADAGYQKAISFAKANNVKLPSVGK